MEKDGLGWRHANQSATSRCLTRDGVGVIFLLSGPVGQLLGRHGLVSHGRTLGASEVLSRTRTADIADIAVRVKALLRLTCRLVFFSISLPEHRKLCGIASVVDNLVVILFAPGVED